MADRLPGRLARICVALAVAVALTSVLVGCEISGGVKVSRASAAGDSEAASSTSCEAGGSDGTCLNKAAVPAASRPEEDEVSITFTNAAEEAMQLWWMEVDFNSGAFKNPTKIADILPKEAKGIKSQPGHLLQWVRPSSDGGAQQGTVVKLVYAFHGMKPSTYTGESDFGQRPKRWPTSQRSRKCDNAPEVTDEFCKRIADGRSGQGCIDNPGWMAVNCAKTCGWCHLRNASLRCTRRNLNMSLIPALNPGDVDTKILSLRERIATRYPHVNVTTLSESPHVLLMENFMSGEECDGMVDAAGGQGFRISTETGTRDEAGVMSRATTQNRNSENAWCRQDCVKNKIVQRITARIEEFVGISRSNFEYYQVVRYLPGQFYAAHHDSTAYDEPAGTRIFTFFLYLSDVEEGGETAYPKLNLAVKPRKGSALLWPGVLNDNPTTSGIDRRTTHEARPVIAGTKYAANAWIRQYDYRQPNHWACTGAVDGAR